MLYHKPHSNKSGKQKTKISSDWFLKIISADSTIKNRLAVPEPHKVKILFELEKLK